LFSVNFRPNSRLVSLSFPVFTHPMEPRRRSQVFDPADGILKKLPVDFKEVISELKHIYDLYDTTQAEKKAKANSFLPARQAKLPK